MHELLRLSLVDLAETLRSRKASPVEIMEAVLDRIDETNPDLAGQVQDKAYLVAWTHAQPGAAGRLIQGRTVSTAGTLPGDTGDLDVESKLDGAGAALAAGRPGQYLAVCDGRQPGEASRDIFGHFWGDSTELQSVE